MTFVRNLLLDPRIFGWVLVTLCALSAVRWTFAKNPLQVLYWASAFGINLAVVLLAGKNP